MTTDLNKRSRKIINAINDFIWRVDGFPLWWVGIIIFLVVFAPYVILQEGSVFEIHDQLDETILSYVLNAKYWGTDTKVFPELLGGVNKTGMQPSAVLFIPLYVVFPALTAFILQYAVVFISGFMGMYFSVKRVTESSILAVVTAACFCSLPTPSVYGLSVLGVPLLFYGFLCLRDRKRIWLGYTLIVFFGLTTHLVLIGYVVLGLWACYLLYSFFRKKKNSHLVCGFVLLTAVYVGVNFDLFAQLVLQNSSYVSHREETLHGAKEFWNTTADIFLHSGQHAVSLHEKLILPICFLLAAEGCFIRKKDRKEKQLYYGAAAILAGLFGIALLYGICQSEPVTTLKNSMHGFLRYFQLERFYWLYPFLWYFEFALVFRVWWGTGERRETRRNAEKEQNAKKGRNVLQMPLCKLLVLAVMLTPTLLLIKVNCSLYKNINQINNSSAITGYISWESFYAKDLMEQIDEAIGREKSAYRVAHLGISPAPALMYGFYAVDGYSNNYPLEYKHAFREVIAEELEKNEGAKIYFDTWGSRCYLFNSVTGTYYYLAKGNSVKYENLQFNMEKLYDLGCEYLLSGAEIIDAEDMGLEFLGYFETEKSYWGIWLYGRNEDLSEKQ